MGDGDLVKHGAVSVPEGYKVAECAGIGGEKIRVPVSADGRTVIIQNLTPAPQPMMRMNLGNTESFLQVMRMPGLGKVVGLVWNEERITLLLEDRTQFVQYTPEVYPEAKLFLQKYDHDRYNRKTSLFGAVEGPKVWEGDFEEVQFNKADFIKFLKAHVAASTMSSELIDQIKNMRVTERREEKSEMLDLSDGEATKTTMEESETTNIPRTFELDLQVTDEYTGRFRFEARVVTDTDTKKRKIGVRVLNGREVMQDMMKRLVLRCPQELPRMYGALAVQQG